MKLRNSTNQGNRLANATTNKTMRGTTWYALPNINSYTTTDNNNNTNDNSNSNDNNNTNDNKENI